MKKGKLEEIVLLLDLFNGELTLNDILDNDMSLISSLRDIKIEIRQAQDKAVGKTTTTSLVHPDALKKII